jgi:hypothetical protein
LDVSIDLDGPVYGTLTVDMPMQTNNEIWVYKDDVVTIPVNEISGIEFYNDFRSGLGEFSTSIYMGNSQLYLIYPTVKELKNVEDLFALQPKFEASIMDAVSETLRSPWPDSNVMIEGSYGWSCNLVA